MRSLRKFLFWSFVLLAITPSYAAMDMFLKIDGANGYHKIIPLGCKDGTCKKGITKVENFKAGTYTFTVTNEKGDALKIESKPLRRTGIVKLSTQVTSVEYANAIIAREMGTPKGDTFCSSCSPKNLLEKTLPAGSIFSETVEIVADGTLLVDFSGIWEDGGIMFTDDWEPPVN